VEELGDLFFHLVMQAQISAEGEGFGLVDVLAGIDAKLKRRHPHVWGDWQVADTAEVLSNWEKLKLKEKGERPSSVLDNIPRAMPALARSQKIQQKVSGIGFDWPAIEGVFAKMEEEIEELKAANGPEERSEELGDLLFVLVNIANWLDLDAESALRQANEKFNRRFRQVEQLAVARKINLKQCDLAQLETLWQEVKDGSTF
jgi:MazG family protein